jgi:2,4-dienoyl-CoA reductase-like NADH-dependent reductase (Old Yellow Enzyme family)
MNNPVEYGYQVKFADAVRNKSGVMSMAVGLIVHADQAEAILQNGQADLVAIGREMLLNPNWAIDAALKLGVERPYAQVPPVFAAYLESRSRRFKELQHSTTRAGIDA